jgi:hypothetical protein
MTQALDTSRREVARHIAEAEAELAESIRAEHRRCDDSRRLIWLEAMLAWCDHRADWCKENPPPPDYSAPATAVEHIATTGGAYYPEMGGRHDGTALFVRQVGYKGYYLKWTDDRHAEALAAFKAQRIRPQNMSAYNRNTDGRKQWSACVTWEAGEKLRALSVTEMLLD